MDKKLIAGINSKALKALCDSYDEEYENYPESCYEGAALYEYYCEVTGREKDVKEYRKKKQVGKYQGDCM